MILDLKIFYGEESNITKWRIGLNDALIEMIFDKSVGYSVQRIDCRESLYGFIKRAVRFSSITTSKNMGNINIKIKLNKGQNYKEINHFLNTSIFGDYLNFSEDGWLNNKAHAGSPEIYSTVALIINEYIDY